MTDPIVIFGGTGGVGAALARRLTRRGWAVHLVARNEQALGGLASQLGCTTTICDVMDDEQVRGAVAAASRDGRLGGLAYCIGSIVLKPLQQATAQEFADTYRLNVVGAATALQAAERPLAEARGSAVLFSTVAAAQGFPSHSVIASAKAGVEGLTRAMAAEWAPRVRVNCIAPSLTRTRMAAPLTQNEAMARSLAKAHPMGRLGEADDVAAMAAVLLDPEQSGWVTGQVIGVDGGRGPLHVK